MTAPSKTPLLDTLSNPADLRKLPESDLHQIADELRTELVDDAYAEALRAQYRWHEFGDSCLLLP